MNRFSQKDILRGSTANAITQNRYLYCINDPLNFVDPSGKALGLLAGTAIAAGLCGLVAGATSAYQSYKSTGKVDWKQAGKAAVGGAAAAVAVGVAVATGGTALGVATMVVEAVAGGRTALRGGNAADVTHTMAKTGTTTVIAGNVLPVLPNAAKAVIGTVGTVGGVVKTVKDTKVAANTFKDPNATTLDKINAAVDVALDVAGTIGSVAYAYSGISGVIANAKTAGAAKQPTVESPEVIGQNGNGVASCKADDSSSISGEWRPVNESMSDYSREYQAQITGHTDEAWVQNGVKFGGMNDGTLVDAKGHYSQFVDANTGSFKPWFNGQNSIIDQAQRQIAASEGASIEWHFSEESTMNAFQALFDQYGIEGIELIFTPKT